MNLLLIEDDDVDAMIFQRFLKKQKHEDVDHTVIRAADGIEALDAMRNGVIPAPYLAVLDLRMPKMGGLEFLEHLRNDNQLSQAVVVVLTSSGDSEDILKSKTHNIAGYFVKSSDSEGYKDFFSSLEQYWCEAKSSDN